MEITNQIKDVINKLPMYKQMQPRLGTLSGDGSQLCTTETVRRELPVIFKKYGIKSVTDAPCGDFFWMQYVDLGGIDYIGYDAIDEIVAANITKFERSGVHFEQLDILNNIVRQSDLIICRDFLFHISNADICNVLANFKKSGSTYLLSTTFTYITVNKDKSSDDYDSRPINLMVEPLNLGQPIYSFVEEHPECRHRSMSLWKIN